MITATPLPTWGDLLAPFTGPVPKDFQGDSPLAAPWQSPGGDGRAVWFSRSAWSLQAIVTWWEAGHGGRKPNLWLPGYFCNQSTYPLRQTGARLTFYPVDDETGPDWEQCRSLASQEAPDLFVLVHTFGRAADAAAARDFCNQTGALLIEDAAHALGPAAGIGEAGDFVCYSPHKTLAVPDGALLLMRGGDGAEIIGEAAYGGDGRAPGAITWVAKRALQKVLPEPLLAWRARRQTPAYADDPPYVALPHHPRISSLARSMLARSMLTGGADVLATAADARRRNWKALEKAIAGRKGCRPLEADERAAPYRFVVRCDDQQIAAALFEELRGRGCPAESWPDLPPEVLAAPEIHGAAIGLRRTLVMLPVHQTANSEDLIACCRQS